MSRDAPMVLVSRTATASAADSATRIATLQRPSSGLRIDGIRTTLEIERTHKPASSAGAATRNNRARKALMCSA